MLFRSKSEKKATTKHALERPTTAATAATAPANLDMFGANESNVSLSSSAIIAPLRSPSALLLAPTAPSPGRDLTLLRSSQDLRNAGFNVQSPYVVSARAFPDYTILVPTTVERATTWVPLRVSRASLSAASGLMSRAFLANAPEIDGGEMVFHHPFASAARVSRLMRTLHRIDTISCLPAGVIEAYKLSCLLMHLDPTGAPDPIFRDAMNACVQHVVKEMTAPIAIELWPLVAKHGPVSWQRSLARYFAHNPDALQGAVVFKQDTLLQLMREPWLNYGEDTLVDLALAWIEKHKPEDLSAHNLVDWQYGLRLSRGIAWQNVSETSLWAAKRGGLISQSEAGELAELRYALRNEETTVPKARFLNEPLLQRREEMHVERTGKESFTATLSMPNFAVEQMPQPSFHFKAGPSSWRVSAQPDFLTLTYNAPESANALVRVFNNSGANDENTDFVQVWRRGDTVSVATEKLLRHGNLDVTILVNRR